MSGLVTGLAARAAAKESKESKGSSLDAGLPLISESPQQRAFEIRSNLIEALRDVLGDHFRTEFANMYETNIFRSDQSVGSDHFPKRSLFTRFLGQANEIEVVVKPICKIIDNGWQFNDYKWSPGQTLELTIHGYSKEAEQAFKTVMAETPKEDHENIQVRFIREGQRNTRVYLHNASDDADRVRERLGSRYG